MATIGLIAMPTSVASFSIGNIRFILRSTISIVLSAGCVRRGIILSLTAIVVDITTSPVLLSMSLIVEECGNGAAIMI